MKDEKDYRTGIIPCEKQNLTFFLQDFCFHVMSNDPPSSFPVQLSGTLKSNADDVIYCVTHDNHDIAIYAPKYEQPVLGRLNIISNVYLVKCNNLEKFPHDVTYSFNDMEFVGGTLSKVFSPSSLSIESDSFGSKVTEKDDSIHFSFESNGTICTATVFSNVNKHWGINGSSINNSEVHLVLHFSQPQSVSEIMNHYYKICSLLSFMTFRSHIDFDKILLLQNSIDEEQPYPIPWNLYIKCDEDNSAKDVFYNLTFHDLEPVISNLASIFYSSTDKKPCYFLDFIPNDDISRSHFDYEKIKSICSSLECELEFSNIPKSAEVQEIQLLANKVKSLIKEHRNGESALSQKSYDKIFGNIRHWGMAISEQIYQLYLIHQMELHPIEVRMKMNLTPQIISDFIAYRNDITHGRYRTGDFIIAKTAYILEGLVYCCILSRAGMNTEKIAEFCTNLKILQ